MDINVLFPRDRKITFDASKAAGICSTIYCISFYMSGAECTGFSCLKFKDNFYRSLFNILNVC